MQCLEKGDERCCLRWAQVLAVRGHIAASLDHLADKLILSKPDGDTIERRASLPAQLPKRMAVAALLYLKNERALTLKRGRVAQESSRNRVTAPGAHVRTPRSDFRKMRECPERNRDKHNGHYGNGPPAPALFAFSREKWK